MAPWVEPGLAALNQLIWISAVAIKRGDTGDWAIPKGAVDRKAGVGDGLAMP